MPEIHKLGRGRLCHVARLGCEALPCMKELVSLETRHLLGLVLPSVASGSIPNLPHPEFVVGFC